MSNIYERALFTAVILISGVLSLMSILRYNFGTFFQFYDFTVYEQSLWTTVNNGTLLYNSLEGCSHFGIHTSVIWYGLTQIYFIFQYPETLLIIQSILLVVAAIPLYYLAKEILGDDKYALLVAYTYILYPMLHGAALFDVHEVMFLPLIVFTALYSLYKKNISTFFILMMLSLLIKEDIPLLVIPIFLYAIYKRMYSTKFEKWLMIGGIVISVIWLLASVFVIIPAFNAGGMALHESRYNTSNIPTMITQYPVEKAGYLSNVFSPLLFLPTLSPLTLVLCAPTLFEILLQDGSFRFTSMTHYVLQLIPILFLSLIFGVKRLRESNIFKDGQLIGMIYIAVTLLFLVSSQISPFSPNFYVFVPTEHTMAIDEAMSMIPDGASLYMGSYFVPGSPHRMELYSSYHEGVDYLFTDTKSEFFNKDDFSKYELSGYTRLFEKDSVTVYRRSI
jgi:uncharacterized membrane protein